MQKATLLNTAASLNNCSVSSMTKAAIKVLNSVCYVGMNPASAYLRTVVNLACCACSPLYLLSELYSYVDCHMLD